jgi:hypothetical protein
VIAIIAAIVLIIIIIVVVVVVCVVRRKRANHMYVMCVLPNRGEIRLVSHRIGRSEPIYLNSTPKAYNGTVSDAPAAMVTPTMTSECASYVVCVWWSLLCIICAHATVD